LDNLATPNLIFGVFYIKDFLPHDRPRTDGWKQTSHGHEIRFENEKGEENEE